MAWPADSETSGHCLHCGRCTNRPRARSAASASATKEAGATLASAAARQPLTSTRREAASLSQASARSVNAVNASSGSKGSGTMPAMPSGIASPRGARAGSGRCRGAANGRRPLFHHLARIHHHDLVGVSDTTGGCVDEHQRLPPPPRLPGGRGSVPDADIECRGLPVGDQQGGSLMIAIAIAARWRMPRTSWGSMGPPDLMPTRRRPRRAIPGDAPESRR